MTKQKSKIRFCVGSFYEISGVDYYHKFEIGSVIKVISVESWYLECEQNGLRQFIKKTDLKII